MNPEAGNVYKYTFANTLTKVRINLNDAIKVDIVFDWKFYDNIPQNEKIRFADSDAKWKGPDISNEESLIKWKDFMFGKIGDYKNLTALEYLQVYIKLNYFYLSQKKDLVSYIYGLNIKSKEPLIIYQGISKHKVITGIEPYQIDEEKIGYYKEYVLTRWSTNPCVAECFAYPDPNNSQVIRYTANPEDILIDLRYLPDDQRNFLQSVNQSEVLLMPGEYHVDVVHYYGEMKVPEGMSRKEPMLDLDT